VRHWEEIDGWYLMSSVSVEYETLPPKPGYVRGEQGPNIMRMRDSGANTLTFQWLFITDVKVTQRNLCSSNKLSHASSSLSICDTI